MSRTYRNSNLIATRSLKWKIEREVEYNRNATLRYHKYPVRWLEKYVREEAEVIQEAKDEWESWKRDGRFKDETVRSKGFKHASKKTVRNKTRQMIHHCMKHDGDYDQPYPGDYLGKVHIWDWW